MNLRATALALLAAFALAAFPAHADPTMLWSEQLDGGGHYIDNGYLLSLAPDNNIVVGGASTQETGGQDLFLRKLDKTDGHTIWEYRYHGFDGKDVLLQDMTWDSAGQLVVAGFIAACVG